MSRQKRWLSVGTSALLVLMALLTACAPAATPTPVPEATKAAPTEIKLGFPYVLSGPSGSIGQDSRNAVLVAVDVVNNAHPLLEPLPMAVTEGIPSLGGAKIVPVFADSKGNPDNAMAEAERLITQEGVVIMGSGEFSSCSATVSEAAERYGIPFVTGTSTSPALHQRGLQWFFRLSPHDADLAESQFKFLSDLRDQKGADLKTVAIMHEDTLYGTDSGNAQADLAPSYGFEVVEKIAYSRDTADLSSEILRIKAKNPDVLLATSYSADVILMQQQFQELDFNPQGVLGQGGGHTVPAVFKALGPLYEYVTTREVYNPDLGETLPLIKKVNAMCKAAYGDDLNGDSAREFMAVIVMADAINRAGSTDPEAIRKALRESDYSADEIMLPWPGIKFDTETGQNQLGEGIIVQVQDGVFRTVWPFEIATTEVVWPMVSWGER